GLPGLRPNDLNWSLIYLTERSSPFEPGARPSNSSEERTLMCLSKPSAVMTSMADLGGEADLSAANDPEAVVSARAIRRAINFISISTTSLRHLPTQCASCDGPAGFVFLSDAPMPIFFRNG